MRVPEVLRTVFEPARLTVDRGRAGTGPNDALLPGGSGKDDQEGPVTGLSDA
ncbi:hypothetical protein [Streptomyces sp. NPDC000931]|uniref:hypothetical protein n=1 Tax=Streptomyces sp. NPDC000931 TaxID=3154372 RepID=UPI00332FD20F